jgi:glutamate-1-semialdehyde 2,1-aminomutase
MRSRTEPTQLSSRLAAALAGSEERFAAANLRSGERHRRAAQWMPGGNTRTSLHYSPFPLTFVEGRGQYLTDLDGHVHTDFLGDYSAGLYGHSHPTIIAAARSALSAGIALGGPNEHEAELARLVTARFPSVDLVRFTNSGTEANLMAISVARAITGRSRVMVFDGGYHGSAFSFRGSNPLNAPFDWIVATYNDVESSIAQIEGNGAQLAAVIVEPMLGGGGAIPASEEFLHALRRATERHGALLILDEVMTSRLGPGGVQGLVGLRPDLTTFGKYLGGGFSFGAFGGRRDLMERLDPTRSPSLGHPGTFNNNTLTMAAGAAGLREVFTPEVAVAHNARGNRLRTRLNGLFAGAGVAMRATGLGSILAIHFQTSPPRAAHDVVAADAQRALLHLEMIARNQYFARRGYVSLSLPLTDEDVDSFVDALADVIDSHHDLFEEEDS